MKAWLLERMKEPSTYRGISLLLASTGITIAPDLLVTIITTLGVVLGGIETVRKEK